MSVPRPRFDPTINWGHILGALTFIVMIGGTGITLTRLATTFDNRLDAVEKAIVALAPELRAQDKLNDRQETRLDAQADAIKGIRADNEEVKKRMGTIGETMVGMKAQLDTLVRRN